ncbi:unnamed protein product [Lactuca virosa]|uniref:Uncharacterized protein n=1 Tax=Lactuca virosa TaxID=75947 RepID=A0AAU9M2E7_9ASTR|nr:unnamed protein product [Lactuca virosa]
MSLQELVTSLTQSQTQFQQDTKNIFSNIQAQIGDLATALNKMEQRGKLPSQTENNPNVSSITLRIGKTLGENNPKRVSREGEDKVIIVEPSKVARTPKDPILQNLDQSDSYNKPIKPLVIPPTFPSQLTPSKKQEEEKEFLETFRKVQINIPLLDAIKQIPRYASPSDPPFPLVPPVHKEDSDPNPSTADLRYTRYHRRIPNKVQSSVVATGRRYRTTHVAGRPASSPAASSLRFSSTTFVTGKTHITASASPLAAITGAPSPTYSPLNSDPPPPHLSYHREQPTDATIISSSKIRSNLIPTPIPIQFQNFLGHYSPNTLPHADLLLIRENLIAEKPSSTAGHRMPPPPAAATHFDENFQISYFSLEIHKIQPCGFNSSLGCGFCGFIFGFRLSNLVILTGAMGMNKTIHASHGCSREAQSSRSTKKMSTEHVDRDEDDDEMQVDNANVGSPFETEDHYDLPIRQLPPPFYGQPSGAHFEPQHEYQSYQQHNELDPEPEFPLDIYSHLASLRLQGNRNTASIRRLEEQQARTNNYMEDLWYHFQPEGGYPPCGPPPP